MDAKSYRSGRYPSIASSKWAGIDKPKDIALKYAELLLLICPSLQYICIGYWAWQVMTAWEAVSATANVQLLLMDHEERMSIELFAFENFAGQAGLLGPELPHRELTEDDYMQMEEIEAMVQAEREHSLGSD